MAIERKLGRAAHETDVVKPEAEDSRRPRGLRPVRVCNRFDDVELSVNFIGEDQLQTLIPYGETRKRITFVKLQFLNRLAGKNSVGIKIKARIQSLKGCVVENKVHKNTEITVSTTLSKVLIRPRKSKF